MLSIATAVIIAVAVQVFTVGVIASNLPRAVGKPDVQEDRSLDLPAVKSLRLVNSDGTVQVRTAELGEISVEASIRAYARTSKDPYKAQNYVASLIYTQTNGQEIKIVTEPDERPDDVDLRVDYVIVVPSGTDIAVEGANGNVWISKGCGAVSVTGRNSDIEITDPDGPVDAKSTNGRIRVFDAPRGATIKTENGNIYAHMLGGALTATTTNGAIETHVLHPDVKSCNLTSQNGGITLIMREDCSATVEAVTDRGDIKSDFPMDSAVSGQHKKHLRGVIGKGDTMLHADTFNGNIRIARSSE